MRIREHILLIITALFFSSAGFCQDISALPADPRVKSGTTANGLSYIIVKNQAQNGMAHFAIAQKVGSSLEDHSTFGSSLLLEQLAVRGTRHFEGTSLSDYLAKIGVESNNLIFSTELDRTTYIIKNVPVSRNTTIDSSLLILYNWMCSINIDEKDLRAELPVLRSRILNSWDADARLLQKERESLFPNSPYSNILTPLRLSEIEKINSSDLRNFYYAWWRPNLQCVIVVGDLDIDKVETQIKSIFSTIPKPLKSEKRKYFEIEKFNGIKSIVLKDKEYNKTTVEITLLKDEIKDEYKKTTLPYIQDYMDFATLQLLQDRISEGIINKELPIYDVSLYRGRFLELEHTYGYTISFETLPHAIYSSIAFVSDVIKQLSRYNFSKQEFNHSVEMYWKRLENIYDNRNNQPNDFFLRRALSSYYDGYSLASTEMNFEIMKQVLYTINSSNLNSYAKALFDQSDNIVVACKMPDTQASTNISEERLKSAFVESLESNISVAQEAPAVAWPQNILKQSSTIVTESSDNNYDETLIKLSNGATIVLKNVDADKDTIRFRGVSKGGFSLMKGVTIGNIDFINNVLNIGGLADVSEANMSRLYAYNHMELDSKLTQNTEEIFGYSLSSNFEKFLSAINLNFTAKRSDVSAYNIYKQRRLYEIKNHNISPYGIFSDSVNFYNNSNKNFVAPIGEEDINKINYLALDQELKGRFSNAADFYFIFTGKDIDQQKDLIIKYIGAIQGDSQKREDWNIVPNYRAKGRVEKRFLTAMSVPRSFVDITLSQTTEIERENNMFAFMLGSYIENHIRENFSKKISNLKVDGEIEFYPESILVVNTQFETDSSSVSQIVDSINGLLEECADGKISDRDFSKLKSSLHHSYAIEKEKGTLWQKVLIAKYIGGNELAVDDAEIEKMTKEKFTTFVNQLIRKGNRIAVIMDGTTADVQTERLLRENDFVRDYFGI